VVAKPLRFIYEEHKIDIIKKCVLYLDYSNSVLLFKAGVWPLSSRHVRIAIAFVVGWHKQFSFELKHVPTAKKPSDFLTIGLAMLGFAMLRELMGVFLVTSMDVAVKWEVC
jgi:hypothetical protein